MKNLLVMLLLVTFLQLVAATGPTAQTSDPAVVDYGDYSSETLTTRAWDALGAGEYLNAIKYTEKCAELYEAEAREMQATLKVRAPDNKVNDYWALNDVGTSHLPVARL